MTVPRIEWSPDRADPYTVWAFARGMGGSGYTLHWGDGTSRGMPSDARPVPHTYAADTTYAMVALSAYSQMTAAASVTLREWTVPDVSVELMSDGRTVRAHLPAVPDPVRWRIAWGDGTSSEHCAHDSIEHIYSWGIGSPIIQITDVPSRRAAQITGPEIGPEPQPRDYDGFVIEHELTTDDARHYRLYGGGLTPGADVLAYPWRQDRYWRLIADEHGRIEQPFSITRWHADEWNWVWRSVTVQHRGTVTHVPFHPSFETGSPALMYHVDPHHPRRLTFTAYPPQTGEHVIEFGDGTTRRVDVQTLPMMVLYTYTGTDTDYTASLTLPDGRIVSRRIAPHPVCPPCYTDGSPGEFSISWWITGGWCGACGARGGDQFAPIQVSIQDQAGGWQPFQLHKYTDATDDGWHTSMSFRGFQPGTYQVSYVKPLVPVETHEVTVKKAARVKSVHRLLEQRLDDPESELTAWFGVDQEWNGGYAGTLHISNHTGDAVTAWELRCTLDTPAYLAEVWPSDQVTKSRGSTGTDWRIASDEKTIPARGTITVGARIEPCGNPPRWPQNITVARKDS